MAHKSALLVALLLLLHCGSTSTCLRWNLERALLTESRVQPNPLSMFRLFCALACSSSCGTWRAAQEPGALTGAFRRSATRHASECAVTNHGGPHTHGQYS